MPKRYIRMPDGSLREWRGGSGGSGGVGREEFEAAVEGLTPTYSGGNLQIGDEAITTAVEWNYADGMPENNGFTYTGTEGKAVMQGDGVLLSAGAEYKFPVLTAKSATLECVFTIPAFATFQYGFRMQLTNGTTGVRISCYLNELRFNRGTNDNVTITTLETDTEYTLRIEWNETDGANVYLNGSQVLSNGKTKYELDEIDIGQFNSGTTLLKSVSFQHDNAGGVEIRTINGAELCDEKARAEKANIAGWTPNKYIGTDANGNLVEKNAPSGGSASTDSANVLPPPFKTQEIGELYEQISNYVAWCPQGLNYDAVLRRYVMLIFACNSHTGASYKTYQTTIDPNDYTADELTLVKFYDSDGVTDIAPDAYGVKSWTILESGEYFTIFAANDGVTYRFTSADNGISWVKIGSVNGFSGNPWYIKELSNGRLVVSTDNGNDGMYYSDNAGETWTQVIPDTAGGDYEGETLILELKPGVLMGIARYRLNGSGHYSSGESDHSLISYSHDYGTTWTPWKLSETLDNQNSGSATGIVKDGLVEIFCGSRWYHTGGVNINPDYANTGKDGAITHYVATVENALSDNFTNLGVVTYAKATNYVLAAQDFHCPCVATNGDDMLMVYFDRVAPYTNASTNHYFVRGSRYGMVQKPLTFSGAVVANYNGSMPVNVHIPPVDSTLSVENAPADAKTVGTELKHKIATPETALVGQILRVKAVDDNGKPTEFEAANISLSGDVVADHTLLENRDAEGQHPISAITGLATALEEKWEEIAIVEIVSAARTVTIDTDNKNNTFALKKWRLIGNTVGYDSAGVAKQTQVSITVTQNDGTNVSLYGGLCPYKSDSNNGFTAGDFEGVMYCMNVLGKGQGKPSGIEYNTAAKRFLPVTKIELKGISVDNLITGTVTLYGVRA